VLKPKLVTARDVVKTIKDGSTFAVTGMTMMGIAEEIFKEMERAFLEEDRPKNLTLLHPAGFSDRIGGIEHLAHEGLLRRIVGSHWGLAPKIMNLIADNKVEAYCMPFGILCNIFHDMSARRPGSISPIGLNTFIDPRYEGGKMNEISKDDMVELINLDGEDYLRFRHIPIDTLIIRGTYADEDGNISCRDEAIKMEILAAALAVKRWGGKVIVQVKRIVRNGAIPAKEVEIPGIYVDYVVVCEHPEENHRQSGGWYQDDSFAGLVQVPSGGSPIANIPLNERKVIVRRAAMEMRPNAIINVGTGIPTDSMGPILAEENLQDCVSLTVESGVYGGIPAGGGDFGASQNPSALIPQNQQFDLYNGRGVDFTFMGSGEMDAEGNVNATRMGNIAPGCGGFIDITGIAKTVVFCSTFTTKGLKVSFSESEGLIIHQEGSVIKMKKKVTQVSYNGKYNTGKGQRTLFVTERAVFEITPDGPVLIEIAKGIDLQRDVLALMEFEPIISNHLSLINAEIYKDGPFGLSKYFKLNEQQYHN